ncbi:L-tyrosine/L-tryptophan isonitrile synthase family protein [Vibrio penaeicida]|uniref:L-tyrosine/L-tryptophan isonitrile synthase family protein n=1 Tax=Vibrio penaeicida TaxID=104609 RepID=UPI002733E7E4|nr:L-tyrosine/L-tryptophan isonitrile synthase family protein [Vibrio penaeicida]MDP2573201.1 L-tyrosine/L-tryptophan isonitrile synthase family protein [Vibrio penaeicida]
MLDIQREQCVENISFILLNQLLAQTNASFDGLVKLKNQIRNFVSNESQIQLLLPAFPCKTNNLDKVLGHKPDMGEYLVLRKFVKAIRDIQAVYEPGVTFYVFSDYHTFSDYISVDLEHHYDYSDDLRKMVENMNCSDSLKVVNFEHFPAFDDLSDEQYFQGLKHKFGDSHYEDNFSELKKRNNKMNSTYLGLKKFMNQDQKHILSSFSYKDRRKRLADIAKGMMVQGKALDNFLQQNFGECIRLSIHEHPMVGKKYSLFLFDERQFKTPWHSTLMFDALSGKYVVDSRENHLNGKGAVLSVTYEGTPWCYIKLTARTDVTEHALRQMKATLSREKSGLILECINGSCSVSDLLNKELNNLVKEFGTVTLKGFTQFNEPAEMENWYCERGAVIPWQFGNVQIMTSLQKAQTTLPLHWNLMCPPAYMKVSQTKYNYEDYTPNEFALYCHQNTATKDSMIAVDAALATLTMDGKERETLRNTHLGYTPQAHYSNGEKMVHPVVFRCPASQQDIVRWAQNGEHTMSEVLAPINANIESSTSYECVDELSERLSQICFDSRVLTEIEMDKGDIVLVNNHSTLLSMPATSGERELWRMQQQPRSVNSPWQPHNMATLNQAS